MSQVFRVINVITTFYAIWLLFTPSATPLIAFIAACSLPATVDTLLKITDRFRAYRSTATNSIKKS